MNLKGKRILITAGHTWVSIDSVRVVSNIATGETGILLANELSKRQASVTLLLGPVASKGIDKSVKVIPFRFFDDLKNIMSKEIRSGLYDAVIHSAAVSDYRPKKSFPIKIKSGIKNFKITFIPTFKIIDAIRGQDPFAFVVGFKFEPQATKDKLLEKGRNLLVRSRLNLVVANTVYKDRYSAYILTKEKISHPYLNKESLSRGLAREAGGILCKS